MKKRLMIAGIIIIAGITGMVIYRFGIPRNTDTLSLSGNVEVTEVNVGSKISGRVLTLLAEEGRPVRNGDKIVELDSAEYESLVSQNRALVSNAEAQLEKAKKDLERSEMLFKQEVISTQQMDAAKTAYDVAVSQNNLSRASLRTAELRLKDTVLYAPVTGMVLRKNVEAGEIVSPGTPIYTIGDLEHPWVKVYVKENKLGLVKLGQRAELKTDSYPGKAYEGIVTYISSEAEFTPKNVQTQEERVKLVFGVKVSVKNVNDELKPGMPADVRILLK